jgi:hypothetical protein
VVACDGMDLDDVITPEEFAKRMGWSARRVRSLARELGACRILGSRMRLTKNDVNAILEATRPTPLQRITSRSPSGWDGVPVKTMKMLLGVGDHKKLRQSRPQPKRRVRLPRVPRPPPET